MAMPADTGTQAPATIIKKYANRRLYNTGTSTYVTLDDLAEMVKGGEDFQVQDAKSGEDLTRAVLAQIIFDQENRGTTLLPITVLRQLIRFYDDSMHAVVPSYLEHSINAFVADQEKIRETMASSFEGTPIAAITGMGGMSTALQDQTRRNMELFQKAMANAMTVFVPFTGAGNDSATGKPDGKPAAKTDGKPVGKKEEPGSIDELRAQLAAMQSKLDSISDKS